MYIDSNNYYSNNVSFGMLKKSKLTPFKRVFCETYHPPLEKMDKVEDLTKWVEEGYLELQKPHEKFGVEEVLKTWKGVLEGLDLARHRNSIYWKYLIYENIKRLGTTYIVYPDVDALAKTIEKTKAGVKRGIERFNFYKHYEEFLKESALNKYFPDPKNRTGWVEFIGSSDPKKNEEIIKDVRALSVGTNWCTLSKLYSSISVEDEKCGMYIFLDKGKTVYGVRTVNNLTQEIRDRHNLPTDLPEDALKTLWEKNPDIVIFRNSASMMD